MKGKHRRGQYPRFSSDYPIIQGGNEHLSAFHVKKILKVDISRVVILLVTVKNLNNIDLS